MNKELPIVTDSASSSIDVSDMVEMPVPDPSVFNYNAGLLMYISAMDHQLLLVTDLYERDPKDTMQ